MRTYAKLTLHSGFAFWRGVAADCRFGWSIASGQACRRETSGNAQIASPDDLVATNGGAQV